MNAAPVDAHPAALALLIYTSGTTGKPKGVLLDHANIAAMCDMTRAGLGITAADHSLLILPLFHVNGIVVGTLTPLLAGGRVTVAARFSPKTFFGLVERIRPTYFSAVPAIYAMLTSLPEAETADTTRCGSWSAAPPRCRPSSSPASSAPSASSSSRATGYPRARAPPR